MPKDTLTRRAALIGGAALIASRPRLSAAQSMGSAIHVVKDPNCGCCSAWIAVLEREGFSVTTEARTGEALAQYKVASGIPREMVSCHTAKVEGYMIEGHVPVSDLKRLLDERPDAIGLAVPGMPYGSPGMGPENEREAYDVFLIRRDGSTMVFARYSAA